MPQNIVKPIRKRVIEKEELGFIEQLTQKESVFGNLENFDVESLTPLDRKKLINKLKREMNLAAVNLDFELAIKIRDKIKELEAAS